MPPTRCRDRTILSCLSCSSFREVGGCSVAAFPPVRRLILYHHAPSHTNDQMDEMAARYREMGAAMGIDVLTACEGMVLSIGPRGAP